MSFHLRIFAVSAVIAVEVTKVLEKQGSVTTTVCKEARKAR